MRRALLLCALSGCGSAGALAAQPPVDADLLEFLGSVDSDDDAWQEYLEHRPVKPADKTASKEPVRRTVKQPAKTAPPKPEEKKVQDK